MKLNNLIKDILFNIGVFLFGKEYAKNKAIKNAKKLADKADKVILRTDNNRK